MDDCSKEAFKSSREFDPVIAIFEPAAQSLFQTYDKRKVCCIELGNGVIVTGVFFKDVNNAARRALSSDLT